MESGEPSVTLIGGRRRPTSCARPWAMAHQFASTSEPSMDVVLGLFIIAI